jgi:hypothetical protein
MAAPADPGDHLSQLRTVGAGAMDDVGEVLAGGHAIGKRERAPGSLRRRAVML